MLQRAPSSAQAARAWSRVQWPSKALWFIEAHLEDTPEPPALLIERFSVREEAPRAYMPKAPEPRVGKKLTGSLGVCPVLEGMREGR